MRRRIFAIIGLSFLLGSAVYAQQPFRQYPGMEYANYPLPEDYRTPGEWVFARLMYPPVRYGYRYRFNGGSDWTQGGTSWTIDYPRGDRHMIEVVGRLTRIQTRAAEQPVNLDDDDDVFNFPWLYAVEVGTWELTDTQAEKLRQYLLRGGFLMVDDFHGSREWDIFVASMQRVFPDRPIVDIEGNDPIFHTLTDLKDRFQVPGIQFLFSGRVFEQDGVEPHWRAIYDDHDRIIVAICHNMDLGDSVEHADTPTYPEKYSSLGMRTFLNYVVYSMTH